MREYNLSSSKGKQLYNRGSIYEGYYLSHVYDRPSLAKQQAFAKCYDEFLHTENSSAFSITSHNTFGFSCSWLGTKDGENIMRYETKDNSYLIWLDR